MSETDATDSIGHTQVSVSDGERGHRLLATFMACAVIAVGVAAFVGSRAYQYWTALGPGPGFFPSWLGGLLAVFGAVWLAQLWRTGRDRAGAAHSSSGEGGAPSAQASEVEAAPAYSLPTVVAIVVSLCVVAAVLNPLGYQLSMLLFLLFHLIVLGRRGLLLSTVIALGGSFGVFVVFTRMLSVPLPTASIPFLSGLGL
ncbi:tripartite tricarboxylate transporter TctB family protein [Prauserella alba]|uniref:DUF1468 domain-containing protein n=1 Tax=Prauserella alba TaxID=176898 RepID=A0ABN1VFQ6_9PSEU|nr:tripartite tricarboxylate transporter TctB family protein [Prauserella alba]MCP2183047.1 putative tricarboxylic transport membrane protein [Prauserella alba]